MDSNHIKGLFYSGNAKFPAQILCANDRMGLYWANISIQIRMGTAPFQ